MFNIIRTPGTLEKPYSFGCSWMQLCKDTVEQHRTMPAGPGSPSVANRLACKGIASGLCTGGGGRPGRRTGCQAEAAWVQCHAKTVNHACCRRCKAALGL